MVAKEEPLNQIPLIPPPSLGHLRTEEIEELVRAGTLERRKCKECPATIFMLKDASGAWAPLDAASPVFRITTDGSGLPVAVRTVAFVSHFRTCPKADHFSSQNRGKNAVQD